MLPYRDSRLIRIGLAIFFLIVLGYAYYEGRALLYGPTIDVAPRVMEVSGPLIVISGQAQRISSLSLNGMEISVTEEGGFSEKYVLTPGYNRLILNARDKYGKTTERVVEIVYKSPEVAPDMGNLESEPTQEKTEKCKTFFYHLTPVCHI